MKKTILCALLLLLAFFSFSCQKEEVSQTALLCDDEAIVSYGENGFVIYGGRLRKALVLENSELDNLEIELFSENGKSVRLSASIGEADRSRRPGGSVSAVIISAFDKEYAYALTLKGLEFLLESDCKNITVIDNINTKGDLVINRPVSIYARSYLNVKGSVYYISEETGELVISGNISAENFACSAPNSHITVPDNIAPEKAYLYINAKSINGIETLQNHRYASSIEELRELISLPLYFKPDKETVIITNVCFNEPFIINFPCRIKIETNCKKTEKFSIDTDKKGEIELFGDFDYRKININARRCNIKWENSCRLDQAADKFNVKSFNGYDLKDYVLGGSGKASITGAELKAEGVLLTNNISWKVKENVLSATVNGVVAPSALKNAELVFDCDGGEVSIDPASKGEHGGIDLTGNLGAYVTVTDQKGGERKYRIETKVETKLPVVVIETENKTPIEDKDNYIDAKIAVENDFSTDLPATAKTDVRIKGRGNSTWSWFDKKPYKLKFESDISLLGLCEGKNWVLLANYADQSLIRNYVALESAKILDNMDCYATQYPVDVFLNGEYVGVYSLGEQIEVSESRAELLSDSRSVDTGFFLEIGGTYNEDSANSFSTKYMNCIEVIEPSGSSFAEKHKSYIENYFALADETVAKCTGYTDFIDVDALIDWFILTELSYNSDGAMRRSVYMKKDHGGKIKMGPMWDFDIAYGNSATDFENYSAWCCLSTEYEYVYDNWMCYLMNDEAFVMQLRHRWNQIKDKLYTCSMEAVETAGAMVAPSAEYNFEKWNTLGQKVTLQPEYMVEYDTYEKQVEFLKNFIEQRFRWIDEELNKKTN